MEGRQGRHGVAYAALLVAGVVLVGGGTTAGAAAQVLLGDQTIEASNDSVSAGTAEAFRTSATVSGQVASLSVYVSSASTVTKLVVGLYASSGTHPGALIAQGSLNAPAKGAWDTIALTSSPAVTAGTTYWIAVLSPTGAGTIAFRDVVGGGASETSSQATLTALAPTWSTGTTYTDGPLSAYGVAGVVPDTQPPSAPTDLQASGVTQASATLSWTASTDDAGVTGYHAYLDGVAKSTTTATSFGFTGLGCGTTHVLGVDAFDAAGNHSQQATINASTAACDTTPPTVQITAPADGSTVGHTISVTAFATDDVAVAGVQFKLDGANLGSEVTAPPYSVTWDTTTTPDGTHTLTAVARDTSNNTTTSSSVSVTVLNGVVDTSNTFVAVDVGPGLVEHTAHEVVRTAANRVYIFIADDTLERTSTGPGVIHAYRAKTTGNPLGFAEADAAHRPSSTGLHVLFGPDVRLDRSGIVNLVYVDQADTHLYYQTFSTVTDTWGPRELVSASTPQNDGFYGGATRVYRSYTTYSILLDNNDVPNVVYTSGNTVYYVNRIGGTWSTPQAIYTGTTPIHEGLAADASFDINAVWLNDPASQNQQTPQYCNSSIVYARRDAATGTWSTPETVDAGCPNVLSGQTGDEGPTIVLDGSNQPEVQYLSGTIDSAGHVVTTATIKRRTSSGWVDDSPPGAGYGNLTHGDQVYSQGNDLYLMLGHDVNIHFGYLYQLAGQAWSPYNLLDASSSKDGSASVRWDPQRETNANIIDVTYHDEDLHDNATWIPETYYMAILPTRDVPGSDKTPPSASITSPAPGATVSGNSVSVTANATDNVGVAGVQFKLDGNTLGGEVTTSPWQITWNTTLAANGTHTLTAVARDAAGNRTTSAPVTVTVNNASQILFGTQTVQATLDSDAANRAEAFKTTATATGTAGRVTVYVDTGSAATTLVVGIYTDSGGHPGTLLAQGSLAAPVATAWNTVSLPATPISSGTAYWVAVLGTGGTLRFRDTSGGGASETSLQQNLTQLPATWSTGVTYTNGIVSENGSP